VAGSGNQGEGEKWRKRKGKKKSYLHWARGKARIFLPVYAILRSISNNSGG
jgi:hypothetical protein